MFRIGKCKVTSNFPKTCGHILAYTFVTLAVTFKRRFYGNMYIMKAGFAFSDSS